MALSSRARRLTAAVAVLLLVATPVALGAGEGDPILGGVRNPSSQTSQELRAETEIIARNDSYGTRQSNKGDGGGAIYGCRSARNAEPCVRANNLRRGEAFQFETGGPSAGHIEVGDAQNQPFTTNGRGRVENLHADMVDGADVAPIWSRLAGGGSGTVLRMGPLRLTANCTGADVVVSANTTATDAVIQSLAFATGGGSDARNRDADFDTGETFVTGFGNAHTGTITYIDGNQSVQVDLMTDRQGGGCVVAGSALGGPAV